MNNKESIKDDLTFIEACNLLKKSQRTVSRYIKAGKLYPDKIKTEKGTEYRFNLAEVENLKKPDTIGQTTGQNIKIEKKDDDTLSLLKDTLKLLQKQLKAKDKQIAKYQEDQHERNVLMGQLQNKVLMLEDKSKGKRPDKMDRTDATPNAIKRFFGRWFKSGEKL